VSVIRIDEFRALENRQDELRRALADILNFIRSAEGCDLVQVFQSETEPERVVVIERWRDHDAHQKAMASIRAAALHRVMGLLSEMPAGAYYNEQTEGPATPST
jgi:quinol monooxygenase YgiN